MRPVQRFEPKLPVQAYQTYSARVVNQQVRRLTCEQAECEHYRNGWVTRVDEATPLGQQQAEYLRTTKGGGRRYTEHRSDNGLTEFMFGPGQPCFKSPHEVKYGGDAIYGVWGGDHRGRVSDPRRFKTTDEFVDHFANHQDKLSDRLKKG